MVSPGGAASYRLLPAPPRGPAAGRVGGGGVCNGCVLSDGILPNGGGPGTAAGRLPPRGQHDAADALGLSYWKKSGLIILPQAIRHVIPPLVNTFIAFFKDTSLVLIIGIFDLLTTAKTSIIDPAWQPFSVEVYVFVGVIYFLFCFAMSRYSRRLEAQARPG